VLLAPRGDGCVEASILPREVASIFVAGYELAAARAATETVAPAAAARSGPDRRQTNNPPHPDHERRAPLAAALAGGV
jgi:hypothetical protein